MRFFLIILCGAVLAVSCEQKPKTESDSGSQNQSASTLFADSVLGTLDLTDKVGEMTQLTLDMLCVGQPYQLEEPHRLDTAKLKMAIADLRVGSILNCGGHSYPKEFWFETISAIQEVAMNQKESGIPVLYGIDAIHGTNYTDNSTLFPQQIGLAATFNPGLAFEMGRVTAYETRASGIPWTFSPVLDIARDARWPRVWETFGEDPHLLTVMGEELVKGYQGDNVADSVSVAACLKHFLGYSTPLSGKDRTQAWIPERQLREYFLPGFQKAIEAGAKTIMINSGEINGIPVHVNPVILTDLLRNELGFEGVVVTDWEDIKYLYSRHHVAADYKEAITMAINAGIDMSMVPVDYDFPVLLKELVEEGKVPMERIDESVRRILCLKHELGLFDTAVTNWEDYPDFASDKHMSAARNAADQSMTLLKNVENALPIPEGSKVVVGGPRANSLNDLNGGWTHTWQGTDPQYNTEGKLTLIEAMMDREDCNASEAADPSDLKGMAGVGDYIVLALGESPYTEKPGDIEDLSLSTEQHEWAVEAAQTGATVIVVLIEGRARIIRDIEPLADAILMAYLPGDEGGPAIAATLMGENNPGGKLPYTYPRNPSSHVTYDHKYTDRLDPNFGTNAFNPQYEFGHGLSYTQFEYSNLTLSASASDLATPLEVSVEVTNTGDRSGDEVVLLFAADSVASITPSVKRLRGFERISLDAGASETVSFSIAQKDLAFVGVDHSWIIEPGIFGFSVDTLTASFNLNISKPEVIE